MVLALNLALVGALVAVGVVAYSLAVLAEGATISSMLRAWVWPCCGLPVLIVSGVAALVMAGAALILRGDGDEGERETDEHDLSVAAVLLDTIADAARRQAWPRRA